MPATHGHGNPDWTRDETVLALALLVARGMKCPAKGSPETQELSGLLRRAAIHPQEKRTPTFRNVAGVYMKMQNLLSCDLPQARKGLVTTETDRAVWKEFSGRWPEAVKEAARIRRALETIDFLEQAEKLDDDVAFDEGEVQSRPHRRRERARGMRRKALDKAKRSGALRCEACCRSERLSFGSAAESEFEVHHRKPLSEAAGMVRTRVADLAVMCASCHRLIHALMRGRGVHVSVEALAVELSDANSKRR